MCFYRLSRDLSSEASLINELKMKTLDCKKILFATLLLILSLSYVCHSERRVYRNVLSTFGGKVETGIEIVKEKINSTVQHLFHSETTTMKPINAVTDGRHIIGKVLSCDPRTEVFVDGQCHEKI